MLFDVPSIAVAKMNVDENATDRAFFPEPHIPNMKFFSLKDKKVTTFDVATCVWFVPF